MNQSDIRGLDIGMLRTFDALMRERSVSRAATRLFLSQPAVSASLSRLRHTFNDPLFTRTSHGIIPTPKALELSARVEKVLHEIRGLLDDETGFTPATSNRIFRITGSDFASSIVLPELSQFLNACGSGVRIFWEPPGSWSLHERLFKGDLDLAMVARIKEPTDLEHQTLYEDHYVYVMRRDHPQAREPVTLDLFCQIPQIFLGYGTSTLDDMIDEKLAKLDRCRLSQLAVTSFGQIVHHLERSDYAAVIGHRIALANEDKLLISPLPFDLPQYKSLLCWDKRSDIDMGVQWLKETILKILSAASSR
jgi:DNA-binding transcriptional LysR family regulator